MEPISPFIIDNIKPNINLEHSSQEINIETKKEDKYQIELITGENQIKGFQQIIKKDQEINQKFQANFS